MLRVAWLRIESARSATLEGELTGERIDRSRHVLATDVKAATAYDLRVTRKEQGWIAAVTLDI